MSLSARERRWLGLLGVIAGFAALRLVWLAAAPPAPTPKADPGGRGRAGRAPRVAASVLPDRVVVIRSDRLDAVPPAFEVGRDLFRYGPPPAPPAPPPPSAAELERQRQEAEARRRQAEEAARLAAIPRPPPVTVRYLGSFGPTTRRLAVFAASDRESVINAAEGEVVEGKFVVVKIGFESVDLGFVGFPDAPPRRLGLSE
jgi:hypothetical protein